MDDRHYMSSVSEKDQPTSSELTVPAVRHCIKQLEQPSPFHFAFQISNQWEIENKIKTDKCIEKKKVIEIEPERQKTTGISWPTEFLMSNSQMY